MFPRGFPFVFTVLGLHTVAAEECVLMIIIKKRLPRAWGHGPSLRLALMAVVRDQPSERATGCRAPSLRRYPRQGSKG